MSKLVLYPGPLPTPSSSGVQLALDEADESLPKLVYPSGQVLSLTTPSLNNLINGGFDYAQMQVPGTLTTYSQTSGRVYTADRWFITNANASLQYQRVDTAAGLEAGLEARFYGRFKKITTAGKFVIGQIVPGDQTSALQGRVVRFQAKMKRTIATAMTMRMGLAQLTAAGTIDTVPGFVGGVPSGTFIAAFNAAGTDPTFGTNVALLTPITGSQDGGAISGTGLTAVLGSTWDLYGASYTVPADAKNLIVLVWTNDLPAALDEFNISEAGLHEGGAVQRWVVADPVLELLRCQRFVAKTFPILIAPAQSAGAAGAIRGHVAIAGAVATSSNGMQWQFPVTMRAIPTMTFYNPSAANGFVRNLTDSTDATATSAVSTSDRQVMINSTGLTGHAVGEDLAVHALANAEL